MNANRLRRIAPGARVAVASLRRRAVRAALRAAAIAARLLLKGAPNREPRRLRALLAGFLHLADDGPVDDGNDVPAAGAAALAWLSLDTRWADRVAGRLVREAIARCQQTIGPEGHRRISRRSCNAFLADPAGALREWRATEMYRLHYAAMRRRAGERHRMGARRGGARRRVLFVSRGPWQFMPDLVSAVRDDERLEVRTLQFAGAAETSGSLFAEAARNRGTRRGPRRADPDGARGRLVAWADVVFVEWCDSAAVWMSHRLPLDKRLVVRLHGGEAFMPWPHLVDWANVDVLLFVGEHIRRFLLEQIDPREFGTKLPVVPNVKRLERYRRAKLPSARRTLGLVGFGRANKDPLTAARILNELRCRDPSWRLLLVGENWPDSTTVREEAEARLAFERYVAEAGLKGAVERQPFTRAVEEVLPRIGFILSTSERESFHLAIVEGMASGCVPVVRRWPLVKPWVTSWPYDEAWLFDEVEEAAALIREYDRAFDAWAKKAQDEAFTKWDAAVVMPAFRKALLG